MNMLLLLDIFEGAHVAHPLSGERLLWRVNTFALASAARAVAVR